ncbi:Amidoligase enzyme [Madurella fahalii]|uniref:Amidoligase enzyme n=1 Tax=Madurella fahalii TaxID=1157608 RepID=A0ABQ0GT72_9PEZI
MAGGTFQFGIEIELFLGSRKQKSPTFQSLAEEVSQKLRKAGISNHIQQSNDKSAGKYRKWSIVQEVSIMPSLTHYGIELVSPIYTLPSGSSSSSSSSGGNGSSTHWATELSKLFATLHKHFLVSPSAKCATHVHVSGAPAPLSAGELAGLAKTAVYFEPAVDFLVPADRRGATYWCQSNRASPALQGLALGECLAALDGAAAAGAAAEAAADGMGTAAVVEAMNLVAAASPAGRSFRHTADFVHGKVYKWNFTGMLPGGSGTVEFRQPPGCATAGDAAAWVRFTLAFVVGAMNHGPALGRDGVWAGAGESFEELWELLDMGRRGLGWARLDGVDQLFERAVGGDYGYTQ